MPFNRTTAAAASAALAAALAAVIWIAGRGPDTHSLSAEHTPDHTQAQTPAAGGQSASAARPRRLHPPLATPAPSPTLPAGASELRLQPRIRAIAFDPPLQDPGIPPDPAAIFPRRAIASAAALYADCDRSTGYEVLDQFDIMQFMLHYEAGRLQADCDRSGEIDFFDLLCFMQAFEAAGRN